MKDQITRGIGHNESAPHDVPAATLIRQQDARRERAEFLSKWLYHSSTYARQLTPEHHLKAFTLCDGYGKLTAEQLKADGLTWDFSHVRDSSEAAQIECVEYLKMLGYR